MNRNTYLDAFKESFENIPKDEDIFPIRILDGKNQTSNFPTFPQIEIQYFTKIDTETLFLIFYYQKNEYERFVAARELKNRGWRFHKKFLMWFKRNSEPKEVGEDFEKGEFIFWDSEEVWNVKTSKDFLCEYRFME